jgi:hypothetical protein
LPQSLRSKLTYANVMVTVLAFIVLGGAAYAASSLPKNSVGSRQIKEGGVKNGDIANNAVTSPKVADGSLLGSDFAAGQLPAGPKGATGATGATGAPGSARAFAAINAAGAVVAGHSSNITSANVTRPSTGVYCFDLTGIGITAANSAATASADYNDASTVGGDTAQVNLGNNFGGCTAPTVGVRMNDETGALKNAGFFVAFY